MTYRTRTILQALGLFLAAGILTYFASRTPHSGGAVALESLGGIQEKVESIFSVTHATPDAHHPGYVLAPLDNRSMVFLASKDGTVLHSWNTYASRARLLPNGNLLAVLGGITGFRHPIYRQLQNRVRELDWNGSVVWEYIAPGPVHHDIRRLDNGNTLLLHREVVPPSYLAKIKDVSRRQSGLKTDVVVEVNPKGEVVYKWHFYEHFDPNSCGPRPCNVRVGNEKATARIEDWTHVNTVYPLPDNRWFREGDSRFRPGNLMITARNWSTVFIIDKESGKPVWEYTGDYKGGLSFPHEGHMIPDGLPGAGNILILDNGSDTPHNGATFVLEINPLTKKVEWVFDNGHRFYIRSSGLVERLPNGTTWISGDRTKRILEVTKDGKIAWLARTRNDLRRALPVPEGSVPQLNS